MNFYIYPFSFPHLARAQILVTQAFSSSQIGKALRGYCKQLCSTAEVKKGHHVFRYFDLFAPSVPVTVY